MLRRALAVAAALVSSAALLGPLAGSASAADGCVLTPPARVSIFQDETTLAANVSGECFPDGFGSWATAQPTHYAQVIFKPSYNSGAPTVVVPDVLDSYGLQTWGPLGAGTDGDCSNGEACFNLSQNSPTSEIRLGVAPWLVGSRSGKHVTLTVTSNIWSTGANHFFARSMSGELQVQQPDGIWRRVGDPFTTYSNGTRSFRLTGARPRTFRYAIYSTAYSWDKVSTTVTR